MRSMTLSRSASVSVMEMLLRTASSAQRTLRCRFSLMRADERGGVVGRLLVHDGVLLAPLHADRMCGADVRSGSHGGDMGGQRDERSGGSRLCAGRGNVDHHGDPGGEEIGDDVTRGFEESARRVEPDDKAFGSIILCRIDALMNELSRCGVDGGIQRNDIHGLPHCGEGKKEREKKRGKTEFSTGGFHGQI